MFAIIKRMKNHHSILGTIQRILNGQPVVYRTLRKRVKNIRRKKKARKPNARYMKHKEQARTLVYAKLEFWNQAYNFTYRRVAIRDTKTRWGSCSKKSNLNFNYKIVFLSEKQIDYIIIHELCHLGQFNHSQAFWDLVAHTIPDYKDIRKSLKSMQIISVS